MAQSMKGRLTAELVGLIGADNTRALVERFGGLFLYIPHRENLTPEHPIAQVIGLEAARVLSAAMPGYRLLIPTGYAERLQERNRAICAAHAAGASVPDLVQRFHLSPRTITTVLSKARQASPLEGRHGIGAGLGAGFLPLGDGTGECLAPSLPLCPQGREGISG